MSARPVGVRIVAALHVLSGGVGLWFAIQGLQALDDGASYPIIWVVGGLSQTLVALLLGWGVWTLKSWARRLTISVGALTTAGLIIGGLTFLFEPDAYRSLEEPLRTTGLGQVPTSLGLLMLLAAAVSALTVWYLNRAAIRPIFQSRSTGFDTTDAHPVQAAAPQHTLSSSQSSIKAVHQETSAAPYLVVHNGPQAGQQFLLNDKRNTIGRDVKRASIKVDDPRASRQHAQFNFERGHVFLYDLASTNGTYVNNRRVRKQKLTDGDIVRIGSTEFLFKQGRHLTQEGHDGQYG